MRSALFVPGNSEKKLRKALECGADALFIDLEDSVALADKDNARRTAAAFLNDIMRQTRRPLLYVRINDFGTGMSSDDLMAVMPYGPDGIVLPKSEHGRDVTRLDAELRVHEAEAGLDDGATRIAAIITETAAGTLSAGTYRHASERLAAVSWGAEDLSADIGAQHRRNADGSYRDVFRFARLQTLLGAIAAQAQPLDTVYPDFRDSDGFRRECEEAAIDGFTGKMAIHPAQVEIINTVFTPSPAEIDNARAIVDAFEKAGNPGVLALDGEMLDRPHLKKAEALLARAETMDV